MMRMVLLVACAAACGSPAKPEPELPPRAPESQERQQRAEVRAEPEPEPQAADLTCSDCNDVKNPYCKSDPRCGHRACPSPPNVDIPACWAVMPCPDPPDVRVRACPKHPNCMPDGCPGHDRPEPIHARVLASEIQGSDLIVTLSVGSDAGLAKDWHGYVLAGNTEDPIADLFLIRITKRMSLGRVHLTVDQIQTNTRVLLTPPD